MAKRQVANLQDKNSKVQTKVIKMIKSPQTGKYSFKEEIMSKDKVNAFLAKK